MSRISLSNSDKLGLISNLSTMLTAGIPILETVDSLLDGSKGNTKKILAALREDLVQGKHLYASFVNFPQVFDKVTINIIKASEEAGTLETTLKDLKDQIKKQMEFNDRIRGALIYPMFILVVFLAVLLMILIVVVPKISTVFLRLRVDLPLPTKILIFISNAVLGYPIPIILGIIAFCTGGFFLYKEQKSLVLRILFSFPLIDTLVKQIDLTRFSRSMYLLLSSGITINNSLELTEDVVLRHDIGQAITYAHETVLEGKKISDAFKEYRGIFTGIMIKIIEAGERTGTLDKSMQDISEHLDYEVSNTLKTLTTVLEPLMLVMVGVLVGGMMLAIIAPIYGLIGQVGNR